MTRILINSYEPSQLGLDYILENGIGLYSDDWNGEKYTKGFSPKEGNINKSFIPVYRYEFEKIDIDNIEKNSKEWNKAFEIVGFEEY